MIGLIFWICILIYLPYHFMRKDMEKLEDYAKHKNDDEAYYFDRYGVKRLTSTGEQCVIMTDSDTNTEWIYAKDCQTKLINLNEYNINKDIKRSIEKIPEEQAKMERLKQQYLSNGYQFYPAIDCGMCSEWILEDIKKGCKFYKADLTDLEFEILLKGHDETSGEYTYYIYREFDGKQRYYFIHDDFYYGSYIAYLNRETGKLIKVFFKDDEQKRIWDKHEEIYNKINNIVKEAKYELFESEPEYYNRKH